MKIHLILSLSCILTLGACAATTAPTSAPQNSDAKPPVKNIPYPYLSTQTQIDNLSVQIARMQNQINELQTHVQQLERLPSGHTTSSSRRQSTSHHVNSLPLISVVPHTTEYTPVDGSTNASLYNRAQQQYYKGRFSDTVKLLKDADTGGNGSETDRKSMYLLLLSHQHLGNCDSVINIGQRYISRFRSSPEAADAFYSIGQCQYRMQQKDIARDTWRKLMQIYPESAAAKRAAKLLRN